MLLARIALKASQLFRSGIGRVSGCPPRSVDARLPVWRSLERRGLQTSTGKKAPLRLLGIWMAGCAGMVVGAVVLGGVTRLTESGLSMTEWRLIRDMRLPRSEAEWEQEFSKYRQFPEFKYVHREITLDQFKFLYAMEFSHRLWGRVTGIVFALPLLLLYRKIPSGLRPRFLAMGGLLGFQGFLGWYMVKSGLEQPGAEIPRVSQYRLAAHLSTALLLYVCFLWTALELLLPAVAIPTGLASFRRLSVLTGSLVAGTALSGAFVAGLDAGLVYNSFPKMADRWIPDDLLSLQPLWRNLFENPTTTQFDHRVLATCSTLSAGALWILSRRVALPQRARLATNALCAFILVQGSLGVATLLLYVPVALAAVHQAGSVSLLSLCVWLVHELRRLPK